jgi:DNA-binding response OmpR family regulator
VTPSGVSVLVVDDEADIRHFLTLMLESEGYRVVTAEDGGEALAILDQGRPDVVLLDLMMPRVDGWSVLRALQGRTHPPIIVVSAVANASGVLELGAAAWVSKPFSPRQVLEACRAVLGR